MTDTDKNAKLCYEVWADSEEGQAILKSIPPEVAQKIYTEGYQDGFTDGIMENAQ